MHLQLHSIPLLAAYKLSYIKAYNSGAHIIRCYFSFALASQFSFSIRRYFSFAFASQFFIQHFSCFYNRILIAFIHRIHRFLFLSLIIVQSLSSFRLFLKYYCTTSTSILPLLAAFIVTCRNKAYTLCQSIHVSTISLYYHPSIHGNNFTNHN